MDEIEINLTLRLSIPRENLTVNGVFAALKEQTPRLHFSILDALFQALEERSVRELKATHPGRYISNGHLPRPRQLRTPFGLYRYRLAQLYDKLERRTVIPLRVNGFLPLYKRCMESSQEAGVGLAVHLSYRRSAKEVRRMYGSSSSAMTLHRALQDFSEKACGWPDLKDKPYRFLMADSTGVVLQDGRGHTLRSTKMKWALASCGENKVFEPVGFWISKDWKEVRKDLQARLNYGSLEVLISDGETGIEALLEEGMRHQRCVWHGKREFPYFLYLEGLKKKEQAPFVEKLKGIPVFELSKTQLEELSEEDLPRVKELADRTVQGFKELVEVLDAERYPRARVYVQNLSENIGTFFSWWLEKNEWIPMTTNVVESALSLVKNRIKRIGRRWTDTGLLNWLGVTMIKIFFSHRWKELWDQYLKLNRGFQMISIQASYRWINCHHVTL